MPSAIIHRCIHKKVLEKTKKFKTDYDKYIYDISSVAPDSWRNTNELKNSKLPKKLKRKISHFSLDTEFVEHYELFKRKYIKHINHPFVFGYLVHLMTDNFWRLEMYYKRNYDINNIDSELLNIDFSNKKTNLNKAIDIFTKDLKKQFNINELTPLKEKDIDSLPKIEELPYDGINTTIRFTNEQLNKEFYEEAKEYNLKDMINGIETISNKIIEELKKEKIL